MTCENYEAALGRADLKVVACMGKYACEDATLPLDVTDDAQVGVLVACDGEDACGDADLLMKAGKVVPVAIICCGEDACEDVTFSVTIAAPGVDAHVFCAGEDACKDSTWTAAPDHRLSWVCAVDEDGEDSCDDAAFEAEEEDEDEEEDAGEGDEDEGPSSGPTSLPTTPTPTTSPTPGPGNPTAAPIGAPTPAPSQAQTLVRVDSSVTLAGVEPAVFNADERCKEAFAQSILDSSGGAFDDVVDIEAAGRRRLNDGAAGAEVSYTGVARIDGTVDAAAASEDLLAQSMEALTAAVADGSFLATLQTKAAEQSTEAAAAFAAVAVDVEATQAAITATTYEFVVTTPAPIAAPTASPLPAQSDTSSGGNTRADAKIAGGGAAAGVAVLFLAAGVLLLHRRSTSKLVRGADLDGAEMLDAEAPPPPLEADAPPPPPPRGWLSSPGGDRLGGLTRWVSGSLRDALAKLTAIPRRITFGDAGTASVSWPGSEDVVGRLVDGRLDLGSASSGYDVPCPPAQRMSFELVKGGPLAQRAAALRTSLDALRLSWEVGRVSCEVRRSNCFGDAISVLGDLPTDRWREPFFVLFRGEPALDAGGVSREFFHLAISELLDPAKGVFRIVEGSTYYPNDDFVVRDALGGQQDRVLTFAGRLLGKALLEGHHVPAGWNAVLLKHFMGLPISLKDDLKLLDSEVARSLELISGMNDAQLSDMALTFSVARPTLNGFEDVVLRGNGCEEVCEGNVAEFTRLRATADLGGQQEKTIGCLVRGFREVAPEAVLLFLESSEELREALAGVEALDVGEWRASTQLRGAFKETTKHDVVVEWFWSYVAALDAAKKADLLKWATGSARCPLGGFAKLHGRDGIRRSFTLTSVELAQCAYPRAHTCFNRIDLPLYACKRDLAQAFDVALDPRHAQVFSMD